MKRPRPITMFPIEIMRQFCKSRRTTLAFRCTCREFAGMTGSGWFVGWTYKQDRLEFTADGRIVPGGGDWKDAHKFRIREFLLAGMGDKNEYCGMVSYLTNVDGRAAGEPKISSMFMEAGNTHYIYVDGSDAADLIKLMAAVHVQFPPAVGGRFNVSVNKYLPARSWEWMG